MTATKTITKPKQTTKTDKPKDLRKRVLTMVEDVERNWYYISTALSEIYHEDLWKDWIDPETGEPFAKFHHYVFHELGISYRTAMWRLSIGDAIRETGLTTNQVAGIGWTKLKEVAGLLTAGMANDKLERILKKSRELPFTELANWVKKEKMQMEIAHKRVSLTFRLLDEQADLIDEALKTACSLAGSQDRSVGLEYMAMSFQLDHNKDYHDQIMKSVQPHIEERIKAPSKESVKAKKKRVQKEQKSKTQEKISTSKKTPPKKKTPAKKTTAKKKKTPMKKKKGGK